MANYVRTTASRDGRNWWKGCGALLAVVVVLVLILAFGAANAAAVRGAIEAVVPGDQYPTASNGGVKNSNTGGENVTGATGGLVGVQRQTQLATPTPRPMEAFEAYWEEAGAEIDELFFSTSNVPENVPVTAVDHAQGGFTSPWPSMSLVLAEPGKLLVGPEFPQSQIDSSRGAIRRVNPGNQWRLQNNDYENIGCEEGGFAYLTTQMAVLEFEDGMTYSFRSPDGSGMQVYIRCPALDPARGVDAGENIMVSQYRPGYGQVMLYSPEPAGGFVSSDGALQALGISQTADSCGGNGCISTYVLGIDGNTGAYSLDRWNGVTMETIRSNWWSQ